MRVLRHADQAVTMEIYAKASSEATREAPRRLGESLKMARCCTLLLYRSAQGDGRAWHLALVKHGRGDRI
jgi:hypothetical protein